MNGIIIFFMLDYIVYNLKQLMNIKYYYIIISEIIQK